MCVFLGGLGHNLLTFSSDRHPLGVANRATYLQAFQKIDEPLEVAILGAPQHIKRAPGGFKMGNETTGVAATEPERAALICAQAKTFGEHPHGLGKITRTLFARDLRRSLVRAQQSTPAEPALSAA